MGIEPTRAASPGLGEHRVGVNCLSYEILAVDVLMTGARAPLATPVVNAKTTLRLVLVTGSFEAGKAYYTGCVAVNGQPRTFMQRRSRHYRRHGEGQRLVSDLTYCDLSWNGRRSARMSLPAKRTCLPHCLAIGFADGIAIAVI